MRISTKGRYALTIMRNLAMHYDEDRFILYMNDSNRVYINLPKFKNFNDYDKMVTKFEGKTGKLYLDSGNYFEYDKK